MFPLRRVVVLLAACTALVLCLTLGANDATDTSPRIRPMTFSETGTRMSPDEMVAVHQAIVAHKPTDVFVIAHGWLNNAASASSSYKDHLDWMPAVVNQHQVKLPPGFQPLLIGVFWPSLSGDPEGYVRQFASEEFQSLAPTALRNLLSRTGKRSEDERLGRLFKLERFLAKDAVEEKKPALATDAGAKMRAIKQAVGLCRGPDYLNQMLLPPRPATKLLDWGQTFQCDRVNYETMTA